MSGWDVLARFLPHAPLLIVAALLSALVIGVRLRFANVGLDRPGHRSLHDLPTPHGGGLGIVAAALVAGAWLDVGTSWLAGVAVLAAISLLDDWRHLPFWMRLAVHLAVAASVVFLHEPPALALAIPIIVLIGWAINAYNFMDGADGLAGSMAIAGFGAYAFAFARADMPEMAAFCAALVAASAAFVAFNWHPARIFMGDVGSIPLGFLAGALGWHGVDLGVWPAWFPVVVFAPFLMDASVTLCRRALRGERVWEAHRSHCYQRMVRSGMSHSAMAARWLSAMVAGGLVALAGLAVPPPAGWLLAAGWLLVLAALGLMVDRRWKHNNK